MGAPSPMKEVLNVRLWRLCSYPQVALKESDGSCSFLISSSLIDPDVFVCNRSTGPHWQRPMSSRLVLRLAVESIAPPAGHAGCYTARGRVSAMTQQSST